MKKIPLNCTFQKHHDCLNRMRQSFLNYTESIIFTGFIGIENALYPFFFKAKFYSTVKSVHECVKMFNVERK